MSRPMPVSPAFVTRHTVTLMESLRQTNCAEATLNTGTPAICKSQERAKCLNWDQNQRLGSENLELAMLVNIALQCLSFI